MHGVSPSTIKFPRATAASVWNCSGGRCCTTPNTVIVRNRPGSGGSVPDDGGLVSRATWYARDLAPCTKTCSQPDSPWKRVCVAS